MFKALRRGFIRMNMLVISLLMLAAFTAVYLMVCSNNQRQINEELNMLLSMRAEGGASPFGEAPGGLPPGGSPTPAGEQPPYANVPRIGFAVYVTEDGYEMVQKRPIFSADELNIATLLEQAAPAPGKAGRFSLGEHAWQYRAQEVDGRLTVAFVEVSESRAILANLVTVFAIMAVLLLVVIWFVSRWFARRSVAPIEEAYNNQRRFVQDASHELKTPVAVIKTNLELLASHPEETVADQGDWLANILAETEHMEHLTSGLLALAKADAEMPAGAMAALDLSEVVQGCVLPLEAVVYERALTLETDLEAGVTLTGSVDDMRRLVRILMENALQYTPKGGRIAVTLGKDRQKAVLRVANTGPGIAPEDLPHVFERFYRGDAARNRAQNSYGLGLSIARGIAAHHRGDITVASAPGETVFTVTLPTN